jgi:hypothetical protein
MSGNGGNTKYGYGIGIFTNVSLGDWDAAGGELFKFCGC